MYWDALLREGLQVNLLVPGVAMSWVPETAKVFKLALAWRKEGFVVGITKMWL